jgi:hypothetical protein
MIMNFFLFFSFLYYGWAIMEQNHTVWGKLGLGKHGNFAHWLPI